MLFFLITERGMIAEPVEAPSFDAARAIILERLGLGTGEITVTATLPIATAVVKQHPTDATKATMTPTHPNGEAQKRVRDGAKAVIASNKAFIDKPNVQPLPDLAAQAKSAAAQLNDLYRLLVIGDFST